MSNNGDSDDWLAGGTMSVEADNLTLGESIEVDTSGLPEPPDDDPTSRIASAHRSEPARDRQFWTSGTKAFGVVGPVAGRTVTNARRIEVAPIARYRAGWQGLE